MLFGLGAIWFLGALVAAHGQQLARDTRAQALGRWWTLVLLASIGLRCTYLVGIEFVLVGSGLAFTLMLIRFLGKDHESDGGGPPVRSGPRPRAILEGLGLASYPTYLFHGPVMMAVGSVMIRLGLAVDWRLDWAILASSGIVSGILGGYLVEAPIMAWRASYLRRLGTSAGVRRIGAPAQPSIAAIH
jgi:peptidoglycan/LPS O-acetylase OafA/YrhL